MGTTATRCRFADGADQSTNSDITWRSPEGAPEGAKALTLNRSAAQRNGAGELRSWARTCVISGQRGEQLRTVGRNAASHPRPELDRSKPSRPTRRTGAL